MGRARATCDGGCSCAARIIDAAPAFKHTRTSVLTTTRLFGECPRTGCTTCELALEVLNETSSTGHSFKLVRLLVEERLDPDVPLPKGPTVEDGIAP